MFLFFSKLIKLKKHIITISLKKHVAVEMAMKLITS